MTTLPKPTITPAGLDHWTIDFRNGATGSMSREYEQPRDCWRFTVNHADDRIETGYSYGDRLAFERAWCIAAQTSAPASLVKSEFSLRRLAQVLNNVSVKAWAKTFRDLLKKRTGQTWSVTIGKGTAYGWITITAPPKRRNDGRMTSHDVALLAAVLGEKHVSSAGLSIGTEKGERERLLRQIVGPQADAKAVAS